MFREYFTQGYKFYTVMAVMPVTFSIYAGIILIISVAWHNTKKITL